MRLLAQVHDLPSFYLHHNPQNKPKAFTNNNNYYNEAYFRREAWREYYFYPETSFIAYYMPFYSKNSTGFITNVINVTVSSANAEVQFLIDELKKTYNTFIKQYEKKEA